MDWPCFTIRRSFLSASGTGSSRAENLIHTQYTFILNHVIHSVNTALCKNKKIAKKQNVQSPWKTGGIFAGIILMGIGGFAALYTLFMAPKIKYQSKVNTFQKGKEMDVYIKGNEVEKELYTQMNDKAKTADTDEKNKLKEQYLQMQMAKNKVPDFIKLKK